METAVVDPFEPYYFQHESQTICGQPVPSITADFVKDYPSMVDRFYMRYYYIKDGAADGVEEHYKVLFHSNRICLICLAPQHPAIAAGISAINFDIGNLDRSKNVVKGKGKKGGMILSPETTLAILTDANGKTYKIPSCLRGKLVEINAAVIDDPKRLASTTEGEGYLAIVQFSLGICDLVKASLYTQDEYDKKCQAKAFGLEKADDAEVAEDSEVVEGSKVAEDSKVTVDTDHEKELQTDTELPQ